MLTLKRCTFQTSSSDTIFELSRVALLVAQAWMSPQFLVVKNSDTDDCLFGTGRFQSGNGRFFD